MFEFPDTPQQTAERARAALALIERHKARPNPRNYAIWYAYVSATSEGLVKAIDGSVANRVEFTEEFARGLWDQYFDLRPVDHSVAEVGEKLSKQLQHIMRILDDAGSGTKAYGKALLSAAGQLSGDGDLHTVKEAIATLAAETRTMVDRATALEMRLASARTETSDLRRTLEMARRDAMTDGLTGVGNRKLFDLKLHEAAMHATESGEPMALLMADIDHFKNFNDLHGHQMGDQVLRLVARTLAETLKGRDTPTRYGGEEFAIVLPATALGPAAIVAEHIRGRVASRVLVRRDTQKQLGGITLSIGAAQYRTGEKLGDLIQRADTALYRAKAGGRNRVAIEDAAPMAASAAAD